MLSYQHSYHAGNFADVIKHVVLTHILDYYAVKEKPIFYLDTHAGRGVYDLYDKHALKTEEAEAGIRLLWAKQSELPKAFITYITLIKQINHSDTLRYYPGSASIATHLLRKQDRLTLCELHPNEFEHLKQIPRLNKSIFFSHSNGLEALKSLLPPKERRGVIFLDPSYEIKTDYHQIPSLIKMGLERFATGTYCLWYPLIDGKLHTPLLRGLERMGSKPHVRIEFYLNPFNSKGMTGCGLWIITPPYSLQTEIKRALDTLITLFNPGMSSFLIEAG